MAESPKAIAVFVLVLALMGIFAVVFGTGVGIYLSQAIATGAEADVAAGKLNDLGLKTRMEQAEGVRRAGWYVTAFGVALAAAGTCGYLVCRRKQQDLEMAG